ncbi:centromere protein L-like [Mytilus trossulus]|uniref:centromere protein L-like n=1 Tax=Mytilus trossulus TaxID=6551 RepID=UPI0030076F22
MRGQDEVDNCTPSLSSRKQLFSNTASRRTSRRFTPYGRTPKSRQLKGKNHEILSNGTAERSRPRDRRSAVETDEEHESNLKGLTNKSWKLFKMTPLYKFNTESSQLKKYSSQLSAHIEAERQKGLFIDNATSSKAYISTYKGLRVSAADKEAVQILIKGRNRGGFGDETVLLTCLLCSVEMEHNPVEPKLRDKFAYYPLLMVKGLVSLTDGLITWMQSHFDCVITPMIFSAHDLAWMVAMWSGTTTEPVHKSKPVELLYKTPSDCKGIDKITFTIESTDVKDLWDRIHDDKGSEFSSEEVTMFINSLESHFHSLFRVKLSALQLYSVGTSLSYIGDVGRLKIFSADHVLWILRYLTVLSLEHFTQSCS